MATGSVCRQQLDVDPLSRPDVEALLGACSRRAPTGVRNRALIAILWRGGLRLGEALALGRKDVKLDERTVIVQRGKGGKRRVVGIDAGTCVLIERWLDVRKRRCLPASAPLFCTLTGAPIDQSYVRHLLPRLAGKAQLGKRVHAHALRHAFAVELEREGAPLSTIRDLLGHSSASVTDRYLRRLGASDAVDFVRAREWSGA